jgi:hypothetical protein
VRPSQALAIMVSTTTTGWFSEVSKDREEFVFVFFGQVINDEPWQVAHWLGASDQLVERGLG